MSLISYHEAKQKLASHIKPITKTETVSLENSNKRITASEYRTPRHIPYFRNAALDGVTFCYKDYKKETPMAISNNVIYAGMTNVNTCHSQGQAVYITTGAPLPSSCDTVVAQEHIAIENGYVRFLKDVQPYSHVRMAGEDQKINNILITPNTQIHNADIAALASAGYNTIHVKRKPIISIISNGSELLQPGQEFKDAMVYDANAPLLSSLFSELQCGVHTPICLNDDKKILHDAIQKTVANSDIVIITAGASQGKSDHIKDIICEQGQLIFSGVSIKPGRPLGLGIIDNTPIFSLPGNTVAVYICFFMFVCDAIRKLYGITQSKDNAMYLPLIIPKSHIQKMAQRTEFWRGRLCKHNDATSVEKYADDGSGLIRSIKDSDGLIEIPHDVCLLNNKQIVKFHPYRFLLQL